MEIAINDLRVLSLFAARLDIRYYLNCIRFIGRHAMATDGYRLTILDLGEDSGLDVMIPIDSVDAAIKCHDAIKKAGPLAYQSSMSDRLTVTADSIGVVIFKPLDGKYLDINKILPDDYEVMGAKALSLKGKYWQDYAKAAALVGANRYGTQIVARASSDESCVIVKFADDKRWFSMCIPMRFDADMLPSVSAELRQAFPKPIPTGEANSGEIAQAAE